MSHIKRFGHGIRLTAFSPLLVCMALLSGAATAATERSLQAIEFTSLPDDRVAVILSLSEAAPEPSVFATESPARIAIDLAETTNAVAERVLSVNLANTRSVAVAGSGNRTRVVIELDKMSPYETRVEGNQIIVEVSSPTSALSGRVPTAGAQDASGILSVDFRRGESGAGRVIVRLLDPGVAIDVRDEGGRIVAELKNTPVANEFVKRLDVLDFATPVKFVDVMRDGINTQIVITPTAGSEFEQIAYQSGNTFTLELLPLTSAQKLEQERLRPQYTGDRISLNFQNVDVRAILQIIADVAGKNLVASDSVKGTIALRLQNVPWDQALDIILKTKGLAKREEGNVMLVGTISEIAKREEAELEARVQQEALAPITSELIQINYAKASEMATILRSGSQNAEGGNSLITTRGSITVDERTNTLLINESRENLAEIRGLISQLDVPVRQVLIESRIVIANDDFSRDLGVRAGVSAIKSTDDNVFITSGSSSSVDGPLAALLGGSNTNLGGEFSAATTNPGRFNVNLPIAAPAGQLALGIVGRDYLVDLELAALQAEGRGEVVSTPRVITANAREARIEQGVEIPYQQSAGASGATSVAFKKAVLSLTVTPQITPDNRIIMDLNVSKDEPDFSRAVLGVPPVNTREITTQVLVTNGDTVVLGGVYEQSISTGETKVPLLGDIPLIGILFRTKATADSKTELLIFVTPKILSEGIRVN